MLEWFNSHVLTLMTFAPLLGSVLILFASSLRSARMISIGAAFFSFLAALHIWFYFDGTSHNMQFVEQVPWVPSLGMSYFVGIDGISLLLVVLTAFLVPLVLLAIWNIEDSKQKVLLSLIMALQAGMFGALVSLDLVLFYIFWEVMLIPMYFMIGVWGGKNRIYATTKFIIYTVLGSLLMLVAAIWLYILHGQQFGTYSTSLLDLYKLSHLPLETQTWLFGAFALAFAIKVPLWPFHTWLPHAHTEAPTSGSVLLAGVLLKMGTYGFLRFAIPLFPLAVLEFGGALSVLGVIGIIYGALTAWMQEDAKKLVAYSSVSHMGYIVLGSLAILQSGELSVEALSGALYQMINHGISTGALFFLVGMIYERRHTRLLDDFGGIAKVMPNYAVLVILAMLGSVGLPGTGGFVGEFLILLGTFQASPVMAIFAALGVLLGAIYMLTFCKKILFGPITHKENEGLEDLSLRELGYIMPLGILIIAMGVYPGFFLNKTKASVEHLAKNFQHYELTARGE